MRYFLLVAVLSGGIGFAQNDALASSTAEAEHGEGHHETTLNWIDFSNKEAPPLVALLANFIILFGILYLILRKSLSARFQNRKDDFETALQEAEDMKARAEKIFREARAKIDAIDLEMAKLREEILGVGKAQSTRILEDAEAQSTRIRSDAKTMVAQEIALLAESIRKQVVEEVVSMAERVVRENIEESDLDRITQNYVEGLGPSSYGAPKDY